MHKAKGQLNQPEFGELDQAVVSGSSKEQTEGFQPYKKKKKKRKFHRIFSLLMISAVVLVMGGAAAGAYIGRWSGGSIAVEDLTSMEITLNINSQPQIIATNSTTVGEFLSEQRMLLSSDDYIGLDMEQTLYDGMTIWLRKAVDITVRADGQIYELHTQPITVQEALDMAGVIVGEDDQVSKPLLSYLYTDSTVVVGRVWTVVATRTEDIEPPVEEQVVSYLAPGSSTVIKEGVPGEREATYEVTYHEGVESSRVLLESEVLKEPIPCIMGVGPETAPAMSADVKTATSEDGATFYYTTVMKAESTAYTWTGNRTRTGTWPVEGDTVAVDPSVIPLNSKLYVEGYGFATAEDTGGAVKGNIIDLYMDNERDCIKWGRRNVTVYILAE